MIGEITFTEPEGVIYRESGSAVISELKDYFHGLRKEFTPGLVHVSGITPFRKSVYEELLKVPFGEVVTYKELALRVGKPGGARAVGQAMSVNPFPIVIPCHRVIASDGKLGGYSEGIYIKIKLLEFEKSRKKYQNY
ncbi:MAG: MGMT family protein [Nitrospirae bacterium YQR-1]